MCGDILKVLSRENTRKFLPSNLICMYTDPVREDLIRVLEEHSRKVLFHLLMLKICYPNLIRRIFAIGGMLMLVMASFKLHFVSFLRRSYACGIITRTKRDSRKTFKRLEFLGNSFLSWNGEFSNSDKICIAKLPTKSSRHDETTSAWKIHNKLN